VAYNLNTLPGNFLTDACSIEAWDFSRVNSSGNYPGIIVPSRVLTVTGAATVPLLRSTGHRGVGIYQPTSCTQHLAMPQDDSINALADQENYLAYSVWWKRVAATGVSGFGIVDGSGYQCAVADLDTVTPYLYNEAGNEESRIDTGFVPTVGVWNHGVFQYSYDGSGDGVSMECWVNGVQYTTVLGTPTTMFPNFAGTIPFVLGSVEGVVCQQIVWDSLIMWKSSLGWLNSTSIAAIYNAGLGFDFVRRGPNRITTLVGAGII